MEAKCHVGMHHSSCADRANAAIFPVSSSWRNCQRILNSAASPLQSQFSILISSSNTAFPLFSLFTPYLHSIFATGASSQQSSSTELVDKPAGSENAAQEEAMLDALKKRKTEEAWRLFEALKSSGGYPGRVCVSRLIAQLCHQGTVSSIAQAQQIMVELQKEGSMEELVDCDAMGLLVMATARAGAAQYSLGVLRLMLKHGYFPHVKVWSAVVSRLGRQQDDVLYALQVFDQICAVLVKKGIVQMQHGRKKEADEADGGDLGFVQMQGSKDGLGFAQMQGKEAGFRVAAEDDDAEKNALLSMRPDTGAFNAALNACANSGMLRRAEELWEMMGAFGVAPNTLTFNIMIKMYARVEKMELLEGILEAMEDAGVDPDLTTFNSLVAAYVGMGELQKAEYIVQSLRKPPPRQEDDESSNADQSRVPAIKRLIKFRKMFEPDVWMYTTLMKGYVQQGRVSDAMQLLVAMQRESSSSSGKNNPRSLPNEVTFTTAIRACAKLGMIKEARAILREMAERKVPANVVTYNTLLQGICAIPDMELAAGVVEEMNLAGIALDVVSYNTLINGFLQANDNVEALAVFRRMRGARVAPSKVTYGTLMKAFARNGQPELVAKVFSEMARDPRTRVDVVAWNTLIDAYARAGVDQDAIKALQEMKERGFLPTNATYCTLVKAFGRSRNYGELLLLWKEIKGRSLDEDRAAVRGQAAAAVGALRPDEALLDALIDAFVRGGYFQKALEVVECLERQGIEAARAKAKYKRLYVELYANLYTSPHTSQRRRQKTEERRKAVEAFKFWVGLPNDLYDREWQPFDA